MLAAVIIFNGKLQLPHSIFLLTILTRCVYNECKTMKKDTTITVRMDSATRILIEQYAAEYGTTPSQFIYEHLLKKLPKEVPSVPQLTVEP